MLTESWLQDRMRLAAAEATVTVKQFALETIADSPDDAFTEIRNGFARVGVFAFQNPVPVFEAMLDRKQFSVLVGMRPNAVFHLGHLTLMRELHWLIQQGGQPIFVFAGYEADRHITTSEAEQETMRFDQAYRKFTGTPLPATAVSFSDQDSQELKVLELGAAKCLSTRKVLQLYGWDASIPLASLRVPAITAAAFLLPTTLYPKRPALVLSDIHQVTHAEAAKIVACKLQLPSPSYSYRLLLPSLRGPTKRMSAKDAKSLITLIEPTEQVERKLRQCFSGGRQSPEEQRSAGGDPQHCSFFRIAELLQPYETTAQMHEDCVSGASLCGECKKKHLSNIARRIHG
ncbi:MAG: hypothetical protein HZB70_03720 [Candidatus Berkelbacteria bacterium]|nr:MAG: hypothetical protein HZB70_03720 [Candidatus Berkelbacteria bacterium]QQG51593.1 MAG: hypothetical protein HY845_03470 [Candidatus Berkelbacteria bacterium]